jgi:hypothetical protein
MWSVLFYYLWCTMEALGEVLGKHNASLPICKSDSSHEYYKGFWFRLKYTYWSVGTNPGSPVTGVWGVIKEWGATCVEGRGTALCKSISTPTIHINIHNSYILYVSIARYMLYLTHYITKSSGKNWLLSSDMTQNDTGHIQNDACNNCSIVVYLLLQVLV